MWILTIRPPLGEPLERILKPGKMTIGRNPVNDVVITDISASRLHAELVYDEEKNQVTLSDLGSTNGTYVNRHRLDGPCLLRSGDQIRIGELMAILLETDHPLRILAETQPLTRELLLEIGRPTCHPSQPDRGPAQHDHRPGYGLDPGFGADAGRDGGGEV